MRHPRLTICLVLAVCWVASLSATASARDAALPNLAVSSGSISQSKGKLVGKLVVLNKGPRAAAKSSVSLFIRVAGKKRRAGKFPISPLGAGARKTVRVAIAVPSTLPTGSGSVKACVDPDRKVRERAEADNCRKVGAVQIAPRSPVTPPAAAPPVKSRVVV